MFAMLVNPGYLCKLKLYDRNVYFNNINTFGILDKNLRELNGIRKGLYLNSDCFIDVGAHIGLKSLIYHSVNKKSLCLAFEPTNDTYRLLQKNTEGIKNLYIFNFALGEDECEKKIYFDQKHLDVASLNSNHFFLLNKKKNDIKEHTVKIKRLDDFEKYFRDKKKIFLKIDAECYEEKILIGAYKTLYKVKYLDIEIAQSNSKFLSETLNKIGTKYNILDVDFFTSDNSRRPQAINLLLELNN